MLGLGLPLFGSREILIRTHAHSSNLVGSGYLLCLNYTARKSSRSSCSCFHFSSGDLTYLDNMLAPPELGHLKCACDAPADDECEVPSLVTLADAGAACSDEPVVQALTSVNHMGPHGTQMGTTEHFRRQMTEKLMSGKFDRVVIEVCCEEDSVISMNVVGRSLAGRVTEALNLADSRTVTVLHAIMRVAEHMNIDVHFWISIPCTAGCTWQRVNRAKGSKAGDVNLAKELIRVCLDLATHVMKIGGKVYWEWPETNDLWQYYDVQLFIDEWKLKPALIASSAVGMAFNVPGYQDEVYVKKRWKIETNNDVFVAASQHLADPPGNLREVDFVQCRGKIAKQTAQYTPEFAKHFWNTIVPKSRVTRAAVRNPLAIVPKSRGTRAAVVVRKGLASRSGTKMPPSYFRESGVD